MTYSRQPWTARGNDLLDAGGRVIATFTDPRDMDLVTGEQPTPDDVEELQRELKATFDDLEDMTRRCRAAEAKLEAVRAALEKVQPPTDDYSTPRPWFPCWNNMSLDASATLRDRLGKSTQMVARFTAVNDLDFVVRSLDAVKAIREALEDEAVVTPVP